MKIKTAVLHQNVTIPGVMAPNMYINPDKLPGIKFKWDNELGLVWKVNDKGGKSREGFFPKATVSAVEVEVGDLWEAEPKAKSKAA